MKIPEKRVLIALIVLYFFLKLAIAHPSFSDENVYFLMGKRILEGQMPYKGFNFVHPPFQIYLLAFLFKLFGVSILVGKLLPLIASSLSVYLIYLIGTELYKEKVGIFSAIIFLLTPIFIAFSDQGYGMWESLLFLLISTFFILKNKIKLSALMFTISIFFRYIAIFYFPFLLIFIYLKKRNVKQFLLISLVSASLVFSTLYLVFGYNFIDDTVLYQVYARLYSVQLPKMYSQYLDYGFFTLFLCLVSTYVAYIKKDNLLLLLSVYPIVIDLLVLATFKTVIYHYFLLSLPFIMIATTRAFSISKDMVIRLFLITVLFLSFISNFRTIDYYLNPKNSENIQQIKQYIQNHTSKNDNIFGESSITDYISFTTDIPITSNYLDSFLSYMSYISEQKVIGNLENQKPKFIIDMENYYMSNPNFRAYIESKYELRETFSGIPNYFIYERKVS
jgi:4-amino-4-deoxy-L-arabinose transferase-like glycosyltransferase